MEEILTRLTDTDDKAAYEFAKQMAIKSAESDVIPPSRANRNKRNLQGVPGQTGIKKSAGRKKTSNRVSSFLCKTQ